MLILKPNCELCDRDLPPASDQARICSYECTFCADCVDDALGNVCPNCGGNFVPRPIRPTQAWRPGTGLSHQPASADRQSAKYSLDEMQAFTAPIRQIAPQDR